jgi:small subunit ribosomal protein S4e
MSHLSRQEKPKKWPIEKKGTTYLVSPNSNTKEGMPLLTILRDVLKVADNRKEVKAMIHERQVLVNEKPSTDEKHTVLFFDTMKIIPLKKSYRLELTEKGKFELKEIPENEAARKITKIVNKKILKGKKIQLNFSDGRNILSDMNCKTNDSAVINFKENKIEKILPLKEKARVIVFAGKHAGKTGEIENLDLEDKTAKVKTKEKEISILINQLMAVAE